MQNVGGTILATVLSVLITLIVTFLFNKLVALPKELKKQKEAEQAAMAAEKAAKEEAERKYKEEIDRRLKRVEEAVDALPGYRQQSFKIQAELKAEQSEIIQLCKSISSAVDAIATAQQKSGEREKNDLRQKLINEYRLFTSTVKNPMQAWSEMESKAFMEQVKDYEDLGGNDYIHHTVLPAIHTLEIIPMHELERLAALMESRHL